MCCLASVSSHISASSTFRRFGSWALPEQNLICTVLGCSSFFELSIRNDLLTKFNHWRGFVSPVVKTFLSSLRISLSAPQKELTQHGAATHLNTLSNCGEKDWDVLYRPLRGPSLLEGGFIVGLRSKLSSTSARPFTSSGNYLQFRRALWKERSHSL